MKRKGLVRVRVRGGKRRGDEKGDKGRGEGEGRKGGKLGTWRVEVEVEVRVRKGFGSGGLLGLLFDRDGSVLTDEVTGGTFT